MRYLGVDYGAKRVGVALSDERGDFSYPLVVLENSKDLITEIEKICRENHVSDVVVGESKDFSQKENDIMTEIRPFAEGLRAAGFSVHMHPEFMTSQEAERLQGKNDMHDASAAALILKSFLESSNNYRNKI